MTPAQTIGAAILIFVVVIAGAWILVELLDRLANGKIPTHSFTKALILFFVIGSFLYFL